MEIELSRLVDALPGLVWTTTPDGKSNFVNQRLREYCGLTLEQIRPDGWRIAIHPDDLPHAQASWYKFVAAGAPGEVDARLRRFDGVYRRFNIKTCPVTDASGRLVGWCGINTDIEERKLAEEALLSHQLASERAQSDAALRLGEAQLRRAYVHLAEAQRLSQTGSFTWDFSGDELFWSEELSRIFELDPATAITIPVVRGFVHPEDLASFDSTVEGAAAGLDIDLAYRIVTASGAVKHVRAVGHRVEYNADRPVFIGAVQDVTATKIAEEALKAREAELRQAYAFLTEAQQLSRTGSYTWDALSNEEIWTDELYRIFELDPGTRMTWSVVRQFVHPDDRLMIETTNERGIIGEEPDYFCRIITGTGALKHLHVVAHRTELVPDRPVYIGAIQDVTASKVAEEALNRARAELAHVTRVMALSALTASIAHEVNQPLASLVTNASTCLRMLAADPPNLEIAQTTAQRTIRDANRASDVIQRLRSMFARKQPASELIDLTEAAREVLALSASEFQRAGVVLRSDFADALPSVRGDRIQLQQVILNLVLNATDAMRAVDGRPRNLWIATACDKPGQVRLSVRDEGTGIEPQNLARLFDAFYTTKSEGMGIGLSISRSIIQGHDGRLWAEVNDDGPGATFSFSIPCDIAGSTEPLLKEA